MNYYKIKNLEQYFRHYRKSVDKPEEFWSNIAQKNFKWEKPWKTVVEIDDEESRVEWFKEGRLNIVTNCIDRHLKKQGDKTAIIFEPNNPDEAAQHISYKELDIRVSKMANVLKSQGVGKGDRVCIYLPMIVELSVAMLACAKIGAIHSVIFAGFSASAIASRINNLEATLLITSDGSYRGNKTMNLKEIVDEALTNCPTVAKVLVVNRINLKVAMKEGRDLWIEPLLESAEETCKTEIMNAEDPLFILYTSGSTGKPKGMVHTIGGYMVFTAYTFQNVFNFKKGDIFWCTADIGWITGHSYILYGPLLNGATTVIFEGIPSYPDFGRFWDVVDKHKVTQFYTAPTAIRALAKENLEWIDSHDLSSLRVIGSVGEPINEEAWHWYNNHVGKRNCPIVDTWWQTETGGIMMSPLPFITPTKPTYATLPLPGIQPVLMDEKGKTLKGNQVSGNLSIKYPWPGIARTIWNDHERYKETYFSAYSKKYFSGDGALRDEVGYYRITGRVDDVVIVSGHNLGTAPIEDAINEHPAVAESAVVGFPHPIKGNALYGYVMLMETGESRVRENLSKEINQHISSHIGAIAKLDKIQFVESLPKTRSGKIMRRILRKIAEGDYSNFGDTSTLLNPEVIDIIKDGKIE